MLSMISFLVGTSQFVISGILDQVAASVGVSVSTAGQLITAFALANAIGTPVVMVVTAKMDQRKQLLTSLAFILLGTASTLALPGFSFLVGSRVILGVGSGVFVVSAYSIAARLAPVGREVGAMSNIALGFSASLVLGIPIGRVIAAAFDWRAIFLGIGIFTALSVFAVARTIPATESKAPIPLDKQLGLLRNPRIAFALTVTLFTFISYPSVNTYITPFLGSFVSAQEISIVLLALGIASVIGSRLGGFLADRIGIARTLVGGMIVQSIAFVMLSATSPTAIVAISLLIVWSVAIWTFGPTQNYNLVSLAPEASGIMLSLNSSFVQLGFAAGAGIGGIVIAHSSVMAITWIGAACVALAAIIATVSFRRSSFR